MATIHGERGPDVLQDSDSSNGHSGDDSVIASEGPEPEPSPRSHDDYHTAHVYHLTGYYQVELDDISSDTPVEQISDYLQLRYREAKAVHGVGAPPSDHNQEEVLILELAADEMSKPLESDVLLLVDIEFRQFSSSDIVHRRKVLWMRSSTTKPSVLFQLHCYELCGRENFGCVLFHNHHHWSEDDSTIRNLLYGDFIRLAVLCPADLPPSTVVSEMESFEERECMRRVFTEERGTESEPGD